MGRKGDGSHVLPKCNVNWTEHLKPELGKVITSVTPDLVYSEYFVVSTGGWPNTQKSSHCSIPNAEIQTLRSFLSFDSM